jgi:hypothetical protein
MVSISEGQTLRSDGGQGWRFRQPETVVYRRILQQAGWNGDGFCIPPQCGRWLLSQPGGRKFAPKKQLRTGLKAGL